MGRPKLANPATRGIALTYFEPKYTMHNPLWEMTLAGREFLSGFFSIRFLFLLKSATIIRSKTDKLGSLHQLSL
jgi:hypothetical protein